MTRLIRKRLPTSRHPVSEFQAHMLADLIEAMQVQACKKFKVSDMGQCSPEQARKFIDLPAYDLFIQGAYACGFMMRDGSSTDPLGEHARRRTGDWATDAADWAADADFPALRNLVHYIVRCERHSYGYGSVVFDTMVSGLLPLVARRLREDSRLYESQ